MAHRGPLREVFVGIGILLFAKQAPKYISPTHTGYIIDAADEVVVGQNATTQEQFVTPQDTGFLPSLIAFMSPLLYDLAEALADLALMYLLNHSLPRIMMLLRRFFLMTAWLAGQPCTIYQAPKRVDEITQDLADQISSLTKVSAIYAATISSLDQMLSESEQKLVDSDNKSSRLTGEKISLLTSLRGIVDPKGIHPRSASIVSLVQDLENRRKKAAKDLRCAERNIEELNGAKDDGQLAQKEEQVSKLTATNSTLSQRVSDLEKQVGQAADDAKWEKEKAETKHKKLRERALEADRRATDGTIPIEDYRGKLQEVHNLQMALTNAENQTAEVKREDEAALQALRQEVDDLKVDIQSLRDIEEQSTRKGEERARKLQVENDQKLELANETAQDADKKIKAAKKEAEAAERKAEVAERKIEATKIEAENAEKRARAVEAKNTENATAVNDLQQKLQEAGDRAQTLHESNEWLKLQVQRTEESLKQKEGEAKPEVTTNVSNENLITEISGLRNELDEAKQQTSNAFDAGYQQALDNNPRPNVEDQIKEALEKERFNAQLAIGDAEVAKEDEVRQELGRQWKLESEENARRSAADVERLKEAGREVEQQRDNTITQLNEALQRLTDSQAQIQRQANEMRLLQGRNDTLVANQSVYNRNIKDLGDLYRETKAQLKTAKEELAAGRKDLLNAKAADQVEEIEAIERDLERARDLMEEIADTPMDDSAHYVFEELFALNSAINIAKLTLKASGPKVDVKTLLKALKGHHVDEDLIDDLSIEERPVLINQSRVANELLSTLIDKLVSEKNVRKDTLLARMNEPRGDETALKRKQVEDEDDTPNKRRDTSTTGIGFGLGRSTQQGSSSLTNDVGTDSQGADILLTSQHDSPQPERIWEANAPQAQSFDQTHHSSQPGLPSSSTQNFSTVRTTPAIWSATPTQADNPFHPKPTKIPGPKAEAHQTPSERQERLAIGGRQDKNAAPAQSSIPFTSEGSTGFSFSAPRHISSGILPHVRKYTRLSKTTNNVLSRHRHTNPGTAKP